MRSTLAVFAKEIRDALRDRRTALMVLVASVVTGPLTLVLVAQFVSGLEERASTLRVRLAGATHAPALVNFLKRADVEIEEAPADYAARVKKGDLEAVIVVPRDFHERWLDHEEARVELVFDDSRTESSPAIRQSERLLEAFNRESAYLRLMARGVSPSLNETVKVERVNAATPRQRGAVLLFLIPMFAILAPLLGGMTLAIDATAGERERGSLEPLLANPVSTAAFAFGNIRQWGLTEADLLTEDAKERNLRKGHAEHNQRDRNHQIEQQLAILRLLLGRHLFVVHFACLPGAVNARRSPVNRA